MLFVGIWAKTSDNQIQICSLFLLCRLILVCLVYFQNCSYQNYTYSFLKHICFNLQSLLCFIFLLRVLEILYGFSHKARYVYHLVFTGHSTCFINVLSMYFVHSLMDETAIFFMLNKTRMYKLHHELATLIIGIKYKQRITIEHIYHLSPAWASYQIRNIAGCACAGNAGNVFPRRRFQRKPLVSDPGMHHGTCVTHVPWCMSGSLTCGDGENVPGIPGACAPAILRIWQETHRMALAAVLLSSSFMKFSQDFFWQEQSWCFLWHEYCIIGEV